MFPMITAAVFSEYGMKAEDLLFRILFIIIFSLLSVIRFYFKGKSKQLFRVKQVKLEGLRLVIFRWILGIPLLGATAFYCFFPEIFPFLFIDIPLFLRITGVALGLFSVFIITWCHIVLGANFSISIDIPSEHHLITCGPYSFIRHPMYVSYFLLFTSVFFISENWLLGVSGVCIILSLMTGRLKKEEEKLIETYGDKYSAYRKEIGKFLPKQKKSHRKYTGM